ncbi:glycoside hydrolase family 38 C-terminal domain-containing protein [Lacticaseibacillus absianus]|uniref:glycoside hydrolase family 38 N-terminal domain-containing protein n=1 Tax=Lacticaseibacillus absianus TaxID=2729623 RepID=UPI0015CCA753|nr:glycoside hydrolase family 38 C-terminal domain-containing protein [Lacticaseibacillus absianus]
MSKEVYAVAHSHWDHEWYFTHEDADIILVENLDYLINTLEQRPDFTCYTFDGQSSVIDRYLSIRPENRGRVAALVAARRLFIGPWYTQADALLGTTESLIRNLAYGIRSARALGHVMNIGYAPDIFGQHAYLPSIYRRFGLDYSVFQRGVYNDQVQAQLNFTWVAPNGESIPTNNIFFGYGPGKFLSTEPDYVKERLAPILAALSARNQATTSILLPSGGDQVLINTAFPETVAALNQTLPDYHFQLSDYETFMAAAWTEHQDYPTIEGELIAGQKSRIHNTCRSERYDIKQLNAQVEDQLLHVLEPMIAIGRRFGVTVPAKWMDEIWLKVFKSQAHNGIGASNSDPVNQDIIDRLTSASRQILDLINLIERKIGSGSQVPAPLLVFNTSARERHEAVTAVVFTATPAFTLLGQDGQVVPYTLTQQAELNGGRKVIVTAAGEQEVDVPNYYRSELLIAPLTLPALGYVTLQVQAGTAVQRDQVTDTPDTEIVNDAYRIAFIDGRIDVTTAAGRLIPAAFTFNDTADYGDSFDYSPLPGDQPLTLDAARLVSVTRSATEQTMTVAHTTTLPAGLDGQARGATQVPFTVSTTLTLRLGEDFIRVHHAIDNHVKDHRVVVDWQTDVADCTTNFGDQGYSLMQRASENPHLATWREEGFVEKPMAIYPFESVAGTADATRTFSLHTGMLKEYQVLPATHTFELTLFRSNGLLGRDDLAWRPGRASGINNKVVTTPDGQMQQAMTFDYFVAYTAGPADPQRLFARSEAFETHVVAYQVQGLNSFEHRIDRFQVPALGTATPAVSTGLTLRNSALFVSAIKPAFAGGTVVRVFNPTDQPQPLALTGVARTALKVVDLNEAVIADDVPAELAAKDYISLLVATNKEELQ